MKSLFALMVLLGCAGAGFAQDTLPPLEKAPVLKAFVKAEYPAEALKKGVEGNVLLELFVTDSGRVDSVSVIKGLSPEMDSAAASAIRKFTYEPAVAGGAAVPVLLQYEYRFSILEEIQELEKYVNLKGTLRERGTRSPVPEAVVVAFFPDTAADTTLRIPWKYYLEKIGSFEGQHLENGRMVTQADSLGRFAFQSLPAGKVVLTFPVTGYRADSAIEIIEKGKQLDVEYRLERLQYNEYEIVVYGKVEKQEVGKSQLTLTEVKRIPGFGGDAVKVVQALPGVARASFMGGAIVVRGSGSGDTRYFLDGMELPVLFHFGGLKSTYNSDALSSVDLYPGGFGTRYGNAVAGVVEIKGRPGRDDRWHGNADVNFIDASFLVEGPLTDRLTLLATARRSYVANMINFVLEQSGIVLPMTVVPYYWDALARLDFKADPDNRMFATAFLFKDALKFIIKDVRGGSTEISEAKDELSESMGFQTLICGWDWRFDSRLNNEFRLQLGRLPQYFNFMSFAAGGGTSYGSYLRDEASYDLTEQWKLRPGLDLFLQNTDYTLNILSSEGAQNNSRRLWGSVLGLYFNADYRPIKPLLLIPGLRYDYYTELSEGVLSARLTSRWEFLKGHTAKAAVGTYNQSPEPYGQVIDSVWGNPDLPPTLAVHAVLGYEQQITDLINLDVQTYYNTQSQIPSMTDSISSSTGNPLHYLPEQEGRMYGLEIMLRHNQSERFFGWIAYTLSRSERRSPRPNEMSGGYSQWTDWDPEKWNLYDMDQTHNLQIVGSWRLGWGFEAGLRLRYVTGNPYTPYLGYTEKKYLYDAESGGYRPLMGKYLSDRMGPFFQLDTRVDKKFVFDTWILSAYLDLQNVNYFFYNSPEFYNYNYDFSDRMVIGGIIIPSLGIRAEY